MVSFAIQGLAFGFRKNLDYGQRLLADLSEEQMIAQPQCPDHVVVNHPAWIISHLNVYLPIISALIDGREFDDPKPHRFGMQSAPELDPTIYQPKRELVSTFVSEHERILKQLEAADDSVLEKPVALPRWRELMPTAGIALPYLMLVHENQHLGQISAWRKVLGLPSV